MGEAMEVQEAEDAGGVRKRKRGARVGVGGGEDGEEDDGVEAAEGDGGCGGGKDLLREAAEEEDDDGARYEGIAEEDVAEVMRWLEAEIAAPGPSAAAGSVAVNGNDGQSCGPSFSAAASTVMASVDTRAGAPPPPRVPWPWPERPLPGVHAGSVKDVDGAAGMQQAEDAVEMEMGPGGGDADEEWLARLLTCCGPMLEGVL